jgi:hypothetical protein
MIDLIFNLVGHGWIEAAISDQCQEAHITASYLSDAPSDILIAIMLLFEGRNETMCAWKEEPGEYRWIFKRECDLINIKVIWFEKSFSSKGNEEGQVIFSGKDEINHFARMLLSRINLWNLELTAEDYKKSWGYEFPEKELKRLRTSLKKFNFRRTISFK